MNATATPGKTGKSKAVKAAELPADPNLAPSGKPWAYGIRTWDKDGRAHGNFAWSLALQSRTTAPDWKPVAACGNGLHCNPQGLGDWDLLSSDDTALWGIVRYDPDLAVDLSGKVKAPWMDVVMTTLTNTRPEIMAFIGKQAGSAIRAIVTEATKGATTTVAVGEKQSASAAGSQGHASAAGYKGHASAAGDYGIACALGIESKAKAAATGAIVLSRWERVNHNYDGKDWQLKDVFAGMVGSTYGDVTIKADTWYVLTAAGPAEVAE